MAPGRPAPSLLDNLRASGLLTDAQLAELRGCPEARDLAPTPLARAVLRRGWLTPFQLNAVAAGRGKDLVVGPYVLLDKLGEGGMGTVYKARHQHMNRLVALKVIRKEKLGNGGAVKRFYQEVQLAAQLHHPNIVLAHDAGPAGSNHYFAMEYVEGVDLAALVRERGPLPAAQACDYVRQAALGLQHAHEKGLVHRDVKPANLLVSRAPAATEVSAAPSAAGARGDVVKLMDMGLARLQGGGDTGVTRLGAVIGTPDYLAPEQAIDSKAADIRSDLYSLGCTFYYLLTGRPPFAANVLTEVLLKHQMEKPTPLAQCGVKVSGGVQDIIDRLMAKDPADRYQTPAELVAALTPFCRGETLTTKVFESLRPAKPAEENQWALLTRDDGEEKGRKGGRSDEAEAGKRRVMVLAVGGSGIGLLLVVVILAALWWESGRGADSGSAGVPPTQPTRKGGDTSLEHVKSPPREGEEAQVVVAPGVKMTFCWVPPGRATLGSPTSEKEHQSDEQEHEYTSRGFWLAKYPVTQEQWQAVMGNNPSYFTPAQEQVKKDGITDTSRFPVEEVCWDDPTDKDHSAQEFLRKMNNPPVKAPAAMGKGRFVLPHEDEWEYAARGGKGNKQPFYWGNSLNGDKANCDGTSPYGTNTPGEDKERTTAVGEYEKAAPHPWGLCDMSGNVWQWCENKYSEDKDSRVLRGGSWGGSATLCRAARRSRNDPGLRDDSCGFRPCFRLD